MSARICGLLILLFVVGMLAGCSRDNGLSEDVLLHLAEQDITLTPVKVHQERSSRAGYIVAQHSPELAAKIVAAFKLQQVALDDQQLKWAMKEVGDSAIDLTAAWGLRNRPVEFRLKNGGQFQYFYLIVTRDGLMYLLVEYSYG